MMTNSHQFVEQTIHLRTLTPLWTGDADQQMHRVHETGLLGSLRWWYEALVRYAGGNACDPTGNSRCGFDQKAFVEAEGDPAACLRQAGVCDVCQLFGATSWRRRFHLTVEIPPAPSRFAVEDPRPCRDSRSDVCYRAPKGKPWVIKPGMAGDFDLSLLGPQDDLQVIAGLLAWIAPRAAIGARTHLGYGVFEFRGDRPDVAPFVNRLRAMQGVVPPADRERILPSVARMYRAQLTLDTLRDPSHSTDPRDFPIIELLQTRSELRDTFQDPRFALPPGAQPMSQADLRDLRHRTLGMVDGDNRWASRVSLSRPYSHTTHDPWTMRIWAWMPACDEAEVRRRLDAYLDSRNPGLKLVKMEQ